MLKNLLFLLATTTAAVFITSIRAQTNCPPAEVLAPCECNEERQRFYCFGMDHPEFDLKGLFDRVGSLVDENVVFDDILITWFPGIRELPANTMSNLKFRSITIENLQQLEYIHPDAFNGTYDTTTYLNVARNNLSNANNSHDNFKFVSKFQKLETLLLKMNNLELIPTDPFALMPNLQKLEMGPCYSSLGQVGSRILAKLPNLKELTFVECDISLKKIELDAFQGIGPDVVINLEHNPISRLPEAVFRPVLDSAAGLKVGGRECIIWWCTDILLDCDQESAWLCENEELYKPKLTGFLCNGGFTDIWAWCRGHGHRRQ